MIQFVNKRTNKILMSISTVGLHKGEIVATAELLAYENNLTANEIIIRKECEIN